MSLFSGPPRRSLTLFVVGVVLFCLIAFSSYHNAHAGVQRLRSSVPLVDHSPDSRVDQSILKGHAIAPKLGNETIKAELGRSAWKLFHTTMARFPDKPTAEESSVLRTYIHLFQRLYPCGECATHFGEILEQFPPQVSSRSAAAGWACHVHNQVNKSLKKDIFDCSQIGDFYDCGCAEGDEDDAEPKGAPDHAEPTQRRSRPIPADEEEPVKLSKEDYQRGG